LVSIKYQPGLEGKVSRQQLSEKLISTGFIPISISFRRSFEIVIESICSMMSADRTSHLYRSAKSQVQERHHQFFPMRFHIDAQELAILLITRYRTARLYERAGKGGADRIDLLGYHGRLNESNVKVCIRGLYQKR
jgi:hypothetical protein